ncbi:centromere protein X-like isoform X1 [Biomphalaria glabrata]|uniref:Centromere protein X n=1 Tax=Biomphalaria glabrata TaxID=6526 RepID=A0A9W2ZMG6_BIOGL|nr:centromere protein X-like isoform X1 [Biomphalaria glabrata]
MGRCGHLFYIIIYLQNTVGAVLEQYFKDKKVSVKGNALILVTELFRVFVKEALSRAADQAKNEGDTRVTIEHFEKILAQLLLDM